MKTITTVQTIYKFDELSEEGKQNAIDIFRDNGGVDLDYIWQDAHETVQKFHEIFGTIEANYSAFEANTGRINQKILELKGLRLRTYLINNFHNILYSKKVLGYKTKYIKHLMVKDYMVLSNIQFMEDDTQLTGLCYDADMLRPIIEFINEPDNIHTFEDLIHDCFSSLLTSIETEIEYQQSDESIMEYFESNDYEFTEDGNLL